MTAPVMISSPRHHSMAPPQAGCEAANTTPRTAIPHADRMSWTSALYADRPTISWCRAATVARRRLARAAFKAVSRYYRGRKTDRRSKSPNPATAGQSRRGGHRTLIKDA